ncbi:hypothetical protein NBRC116493_04550 [Aurantivibrio infirmus]
MTINAYESPESSPQDINQYSQEPTQCGLGISAFILTILVFTGLIGFIIFAASLGMNNPEAMNESSPQMIMAGLVIIVSLILLLVSLVLSLISVFRKNKKKIFGILSLILNIILILLVGTIMLVGILAG